MTTTASTARRHADSSTILGGGVSDDYALAQVSAVLNAIGPEMGTLVTASELGYRRLPVANPRTGEVREFRIGRGKALSVLSVLEHWGYVVRLGERGPSIVFARTDRGAVWLGGDADRSIRATLAARARSAR